MATDIWIVNGIPGAGKSTVARALCDRLPAAAHIEGDLLQACIRSGAVPPGAVPQDEERRQIALCVRNQCLLAASFADSGFTPAIDYVLTSRARLEEYRAHLPGRTLRLVTLDPGIDAAFERDRLRPEKTLGMRWAHLREQIVAELSGVGLWIDSAGITAEETVSGILEKEEQARV